MKFFNMSIELKFQISVPGGFREGVYLIPHENQKKWPTCTKIGVGTNFFLPMNFNMSIELKFRISAPEGFREGVYLIPHEKTDKVAILILILQLV